MGTLNCTAGDEDGTTGRINKEITEARKREMFQKRVLLLGPGEAGKTTFLKQILFANEGIQSTVLYQQLVATTAAVMRDNMVKAIRKLILMVEEDENLTSMVKDSEESKKMLAAMNSLKQSDVLAYSDDVWDSVQLLWSSPVFKELQCKNMDSWDAYFLDSMPRILASDYAPTSEDLLRVRNKTTGVREYALAEPETKQQWLFIDVGGQKTERRKWIHNFDSVKAVIYLSSLSGYDMTLEEDCRSNRMDDDIFLFGTVANMTLLPDTWILFQNKVDIFMKKIQVSPISRYFPSIDQSQETNVEYAIGFFRKLFEQKFTRGKLFIHTTCAVDTKAFSKLLRDVKKHILNAALDGVGL